ncbi:VOC family protein [Primorskyibacter sp. S187A]|uniref:VOC family protein n=1 Tax=Primorskyibacter sp. S187A TaxID=3415130 RepID=UPI003C7E3FA6
MRVTQYYPVIQSDAVAETAEFYKRHFGFRAAFEADWYVHLQSEADPSVNLAVLKSDHETIPEEARGASRGMILNFEVEDIDAVDQRLRSEGVPLAKPLVSEPFGQRHAIYRDPNGVLIDVITPIPPSAEFLAQYAADAVPA